MNTGESRAWEIGFALFFGIPIYLSGYSTFGLQTSFFIHVGLVVIYAILLLMFGRRSAIEMGVLVAVIAVLVAVLLPVFQHEEQNKQRQKITQLR